MDFQQNLSDHMPEKSDLIAHNGKQNVLVYHTRQNLLKFPQGVITYVPSSPVMYLSYDNTGYDRNEIFQQDLEAEDPEIILRISR